MAQDIALDDASNQVATWQPIGDANGDGRPDLAAPIFLGPPTAPPPYGPPRPSGLRIATAMSVGADGWILTTQDVAPDYAVDDAARWKLAGDLDGDGLADLFDAVYLGQPGDGGPSGLRIHALLSTSPGTWAFTSQDVAPDYAINGAPHWLPAGDLDGDGHPDLFDTAYLPPTSSGQRAGLRVYSALWTGPGTWRLSSHDVSMPVTPDDLGTWRPGVFDAGHRPDFVTFNALSGSNPQVLAIILHSSPTGTWTTEIKGISSVGVIENLASWRVADVNGDGQSDLVSASLLDSGPGLRIRVALRATALAGFSSGFQDVSATYTSADTANWSAFDVNGDGLADLVEVARLDQSPDQPGGLRINAAISSGDGGWTFTSQDIASDDTAADATLWQVSGWPR